MKTINKPLGLIFYASAMILSGLGMILYCGLGLYGDDNALAFVQPLFSNQHIFFYHNFQDGSLKIILTIRLVIAAAQLFSGIALLRLQSWSLWILRTLTLGFMAFTFFNPFYPDYYTAIGLVVLTSFLLYLFHPRIENLYLNKLSQATNSRLSPVEKSKLTILLGCFEILIGLGLMRLCLWEMPLSAFSFYFPTKIAISFYVMIPKVPCFLGSLLIFLTGLLTVSFRPLGRMLNIILCDLIFLMVIGGIFLADQSFLKVGKILVAIVISLLACIVVFFLLTNPKVNQQFQSYRKKHWAFRMACLLIFGLFLGAASKAAKFGITHYPHLFDTTIIKDIARDTPQWRNSTYHKTWQNIRSQLTSLYKSGSN